MVVERIVKTEPKIVNHGPFNVLERSIQFNNTFKNTRGVVVKELDHGYVVDFHNDGVDFRGIWPKDKFTKVIN